MKLSAGRPSNKSAKETAMESVKIVDDLPEEKTKRFNVQIPASLHLKIKVQTAMEDITMNTLAIRLFEKYLSECDNDKLKL